VEVEFSVGQRGWTELALYNGMGQRVMGVVEGQLEAGVYRVQVPVRELAPGVYFYRLRSGPFVQTHRLIISE
jgi:hypothetical protein